MGLGDADMNASKLPEEDTVRCRTTYFMPIGSLIWKRL